jgi:UDP-GlcNAc3NAcA epimerase
MKIATIVGARPQFVKAAIVSREIRENPHLDEILIHTGQHYDANMSDVFFEELDIPHPDFNLGIGSGSHGVQTARMLEKLEALFIEITPDWIIVYGDTNSTIAAALAAAKLNIPVAHVEAGLRSFNRQMPEEINRVLTDHLGNILFAPTATAVQNLKHEGIAPDKIYQVGDVMYDAAMFYAQKAAQHSTILQKLVVQEKNYILATVHRASNTDNPTFLQNLFDAFVQVAQQIPVVLPLHPRTREALARLNRLEHYREQLHIIDPVGYLDMIRLEQSASLIATDSGGIQKEAYFYGVSCVTLREESEWVELIESGVNTLCPPQSPESTAACILKELDKPIPSGLQLYGDGRAASKIVQVLAKQ